MTISNSLHFPMNLKIISSSPTKASVRILTERLSSFPLFFVFVGFFFPVLQSGSQKNCFFSLCEWPYSRHYSYDGGDCGLALAFVGTNLQTSSCGVIQNWGLLEFLTYGKSQDSFRRWVSISGDSWTHEKRTTGKGESLPVWGGRPWSHCNLRYQGVCLEAGEIQSFWFLDNWKSEGSLSAPNNAKSQKMFSKWVTFLPSLALPQLPERLCLTEHIAGLGYKC